MSACVMVVDGCEECASFTRCEGDCGDLHYMVAELVATEDGHEIWHQAHYCPKCGRRKQHLDGSADDVVGRCRAGNCITWSCPGCGHDRGSTGPALCPCSASWLTRVYFRLIYPLKFWRRS